MIPAVVGMMAQDAQSNIIGAATQSVGGLVSEALGSLFGTQKRADKRQLTQQQKLTDIQTAANKELADYGYGLQMEGWKETNAKQMQDWHETFDKTAEYNTPAAEKARLKAAGLNPALMYGMSGAGGSTAAGQSPGGQIAAGGTGSASGGSAANAAENEANAIQRMGMGLQMQQQRAQIKLLDAQARDLEAGADLKKGQTITENEKREAFIELMKQQGQNVWLENVRKRYENEPDGKDELTLFGNKIYGSTAIKKEGLFNQERTTAIAKAYAETQTATSQELKNLAEKALTDRKTEGYLTELLNATIHAEADKVKAEAVKLATQFETGEYTNWKTWVNLASEIIKVMMK